MNSRNSVSRSTPEEQVVRSVVAMHQAIWYRGFGAFFRETGKGLPDVLATLGRDRRSPHCDTAMQRPWWELEDAGFRHKESIETYCERAARLAQRRSSALRRGAASWFLLANWVDEGRLDDCDSIGERALELAGRELSCEVLNWTMQLLEEGEAVEADRWATAFVRILAGDALVW